MDGLMELEVQSPEISGQKQHLEHPHQFEMLLLTVLLLKL